MRVGIIGGGLMGTTIAWLLTQAGHQVTIIEQGNDLGGLNGDLDFEDGLTVARYQHAILPTDQSVQDLCARLGLQDDLIFQNARTGFVHERQIYPMTNIRDFLVFPLINLRDRFRLGNTIIQARNRKDWLVLDSIPVRQWLVNMCGQSAFEQIWRPLLEAKFDGVYDQVAATYVWAWLNRMSGIRQGPTMQGTIGYLRGGHGSLIQKLAQAITEAGGEILLNTRVREIELVNGQAGRVRTFDTTLDFDAVVAAIATPTFSRLIPSAESSYLRRLESSTYLGLICPVMVLNHPLSPYWTLNLTDAESPFSTVISTPHPVNPNYHVVYLPRYTAPDNDWMGVSDDEIREAWLAHLKLIFPAFNESWIEHFAVSRSRYVEPIFNIHMLETMPAVQTPYAGLYLANTAQVYPDLPTSESAIVHAGRVAQIVRQGKTVSERVTVS
jgi:protoporphyrinogen oxidase